MYLCTDEEAEAAEALAMAAQMAFGVRSDLQRWRWLVIALHTATQGFMVLSLRHGNGLLALTDDCYAAWMEAHDSGKPYPIERLDSFLNLYKKVKAKEIGSLGGNSPFAPKGSLGRSIKKLNAFRNEFIHFTPKGWSLEISGLPYIGIDCAALIAFLGWETQNIFWHSDKSRALAQVSHGSLVEHLQALDTEYRQKSRRTVVGSQGGSDA